MESSPTKRRSTFEHAVIGLVIVAGFLAMAGPIGNNSMLLHLRTGYEMVRTGSIPRHDPYSFTAGGDLWVVQSWFAEWTYGILHRIGGWHLVILEQMVLAAFIASMVALVARSGSMLRTGSACVLALSIGIPIWSARPALFGLACFAALVYVVDTKRSSLWLLPIGWIWVNTHGSFPLGIAWLFVTACGAWLDDRSSLKGYIKPCSAFFGGLLLGGALNPLGPKLLLFAFEAAGTRKAVFNNIVEWSSPDFHDFGAAVQLVAIGLVLMVLFARRVPWRYGLPVAVFLIASLFSARNLAVLALVVVPALRVALADPLHKPKPSYMSPVVAAIVALVAVVAIGGASFRVLSSDALDLEAYPVDALAWMEQAGLLEMPHHVATQDVVGCYRIFRDGSKWKVFIDDRFDMYPVSVSRDYLNLLRGTADPQPILDRYDVDVVLWENKTPLTFNLQYASGWRTVYTDEHWTVFTTTNFTTTSMASSVAK